jgi:hypothetical protein
MLVIPAPTYSLAQPVWIPRITVWRDDGTTHRLRLDLGTTKNDDGRLVYMPPDLKRLVAAQVDRVRTLERRGWASNPVSVSASPRPASGRSPPRLPEGVDPSVQQIGRARRLRHDFRRTAVRNMVNAGVPERVAMKVTGHRTRSVLTATTSRVRRTSKTWPGSSRAQSRAQFCPRPLLPPP